MIEPSRLGIWLELPEGFCRLVEVVSDDVAQCESAGPRRQLALASTIYSWHYVCVRVMPSIDGLSPVGVRGG